MYNRYLPRDGYVPVESDSGPNRDTAGAPREKSSLLSSLLGKGGLLGGLGGLLGGDRREQTDADPDAPRSGLSALLEQFGLGKLDRGDILLLLVLIYLFRETEDDEWLIILALVLLMGL